MFTNVDIYKCGQFQALTFSSEYVDNFKEVDIAQHEDIGF